MKTWIWFAAGAALLYLFSKKGIYVSRGGVSSTETAEFRQDTEVSATVSASGAEAATLTAEDILGDSIGWRL